jgi:hypothetical protein
MGFITRWRRRSSSLSNDDNIVGADKVQIQQLNSRFGLRISTSDKVKISLKETAFHSDDSAYSTSSSCSDQSSIGTTQVKCVRFSDQAVEFLPYINFPSAEEASAIWFSASEISEMKNSLRKIWKGPHINDPDFVTAVDMVQQLFAGQNVPDEENLNDFDGVIEPSQIKLIETYKDCARIFERHEGRGLERLYYGKSTFSKVGAKSLHVQRHVRSVLDTQGICKDIFVVEANDTHFEHCEPSPSTWWARISATVDAESVQNEP